MVNPCTERTIQEGQTIVYYPDDKSSTVAYVTRKSRRERDKCQHTPDVWRAVARKGHGKWGRVCHKCGALGRG